MSTGLSDRQIARALNISRPVVAKYWRGFQASELKPERIESMAGSELLQKLENQPRIEKCAKYRRLALYFTYFVKELKRKRVTLHRLWEEYRQKHPDGYQYSQFCYHFQMWRNASEVSMHIDHKAGDKIFVDYTGEKLVIMGRKTGEEKPLEVFVAILGASELTYVEATPSPEKQEWIRSNERAFWYFWRCYGCTCPGLYSDMCPLS